MRAATRSRGTRRPRFGTGGALFAAVVLTFIVYFVPMLEFAAWPLLLVSTLVHELGHGVAALAMGARFETLLLYPDASGVAIYRGDLARLPRALVAFGGLLGPPLAAAGLFLASRTAGASRIALACTAGLLVLVGAIWVDGGFALGFVAILAAISALVAWRLHAAAQFVAVFLAIQLSLAVFSRADYLFTREAWTAQGPIPSDSQQIAQALGLPYWFWGALVAALSVLLLAWGLRRFMRTLR